VSKLSRVEVEARSYELDPSFPFAQRILFPDGRMAAEAKVTMVTVDLQGRPVPVPDALRDRLAS
jgi:acyl-CoA thioesterase FadM